MKRVIVLLVMAFFTLTTSGIGEAEAKRFGMGSSFGKQRMFKQPTQQRTATKKATPANTQKGSARTGMMGMIGGLALGGLLGAMFFGGAFEGINFFDLLIFAALGFILFKLLTSRARRAEPMAYANNAPNAGPQQNFDLFGGGVTEEPDVQGQALRPEIDEAFFLGAAKSIFNQMQAAWDRKDMDEVRGFCTPEVASRIELEMEELGDKNTSTEVATLDALITDSWIESNLEWVAVHFTAMIKEQVDGAEAVSHEVQEHWIFQHDPSSEEPTWYLAGIQQG